MIDPLTQDACAFYTNHSVLDEFFGVVYEEDEGVKVANALVDSKAVSMNNHGPLTVGQTVNATALWFIRLERSCQVHLLAEAAGMVSPIPPEHAASIAKQVGRDIDR
ncbi:hypothetical protein CSV80_10620 [Sporosarcina sp. P12(2017)]|nr:hypothetical protein CSV81_10950 [Sporosarcina sp. P10]PIC60535.1 hypothetical protein CSV80_10620 [Sporosarcina sp. P12(2017)]